MRASTTWLRRSRALVLADDGRHQAQKLRLLLFVDRADKPAGHIVRPRVQVLQHGHAFGSEPNRLSPAVVRIARGLDEPPSAEPGHDLSHGRAVERDALAEGALVEGGFTVKSFQGRELRRGDDAGNLVAPQEVHRLEGPAQQVAWVTHEVFGRTIAGHVPTSAFWSDDTTR